MLIEPSVILFEPWETKLPWVKNYLLLLEKQPLTVDDCLVLPKIRQDAIRMHLLWAKDQKNSSVFTRDRIDEKFQEAVTQIVNRFCIPAEEAYKQTLAQFKAATPQADDHEKLQANEQLKVDYLNAASIRYQAAIDSRFKLEKLAKLKLLSISVPTAAKAEANFNSEVNALKERYLCVLKEEKRALQDRYAELQNTEDALQKAYIEKNKSVDELRNTVREFEEGLEQKISKLEPSVQKHIEKKGSSDSLDGIPVPPPLALFMASVIPVPPPLPPLSSLVSSPRPSVMAATSNAADKSSAPVVVKALASGLSMMDELKGARLTPGKKRTASRQTEERTIQQAFSGILQSSAPKITPTAVTRVDSQKELQAHLQTNAQKIVVKTRVISEMQARNKEQEKLILELTKQKRAFDTLTRKLKCVEEDLIARKALDVPNSPEIVAPPQPEVVAIPTPPHLPPGLDFFTYTSTQFRASKSNSTPQRALNSTDGDQTSEGVAPPTPPRVLTALASNSILTPPASPKASSSLIEEGEQVLSITSSPPPVKSSPPPTYMADLLKRLAALSASEDSDEEESDEEKARDVAAATEQASKQKRQLTEAIIAKYVATVTPEGDEHSSRELDQMRENCQQVKRDLECAVQQSKVNMLLDRVAKIEQRDNEPSQSPVVLESQIPYPDDTLPQPVEGIDELIAEPRSFLGKATLAESPLHQLIITKLRGDQAALAYYSRIQGELILRNAFGNASLSCLTPAAIKDCLVISHYVAAKRREITAKHMSPKNAELYNTSLDAFYPQALAIRLSGAAPKDQLKSLKEAANQHFKRGDKYIRFFADAAIMLTALALTGVVVGSAVVAVGLVTSSFFSQKPSTRKRDFEKLLVRDVDDANGSLLGPISGG